MAQASQQGTTATGTLGKGSRITGADRDALGAQLAERYQAGMSIRALAEDTGRSFGFVHGVIKEAGVPLRARGGATRGAGRTSGTAAKAAGSPQGTTTVAPASPAKKTSTKGDTKAKAAKPGKKAVEAKPETRPEAKDAKDGKKAKSGGKKKGKGR